jgi:hypothetical protein
MVSFLNNYGKEAGDAIATIGFATKVNNLYIGAFYGGNFWTGILPNNYTEAKFDDLTAAPSGVVAGNTYDVYNSINVGSDAVNNAAILLGFADMGIRLTYRTNHQSFNRSNLVAPGVALPEYLLKDPATPPATRGQELYRNYHTENGYIAPQIAWGMAKNLTENGIKPYVTLDLVFNREYQKVETNGADADGNSGERIVRSNNSFDPSLAAGLGGYTFHNKDGFRASFDFDYVLTLNIFDNEYSYNDNGIYKTAKIKGRYSPGSFAFQEKSYIYNSLTPSLSGQWGSDRMALRFKLNLPVTLATEESSNMLLNNSNLFKAGGPELSTTTFTFRPDIRLALQFKVVPDRLTLNAGARIQATENKIKTEDRQDYDADGASGAETRRHDNSFGSDFASNFSIGATFSFTENVWVEATTGISNLFGRDSVINIFSAENNPFSFGSIMVGLKF